MSFRIHHGKARVVTIVCKTICTELSFLFNINTQEFSLLSSHSDHLGSTSSIISDVNTYFIQKAKLLGVAQWLTRLPSNLGTGFKYGWRHSYACHISAENDYRSYLITLRTSLL